MAFEVSKGLCNKGSKEKTNDSTSVWENKKPTKMGNSVFEATYNVRLYKETRKEKV